VWSVYFEEKETYQKKVKDALDQAFEKAKKKIDNAKDAWKPVAFSGGAVRVGAEY